MKLYRLILYLLLLTGNSFLLAHTVETSGIRSDTVVNRNISLPLYFVKNNGQYPSDIKYKLHAAGMNLLFFESCVTYQFYHNCNSQKDEISNSKGSKTINNISISFVNASKKVVLIGDELLEGKINCFNGADASNWQTNVPTSKNLVYKGIYDNIDIKYYSLKGKIKYDINVHPQGDLDKVVFQYHGVEKIMKDGNGKLILLTSKGSFTEDIPEAYQIIDHKKRLVKIDYQINDNNRVSFKIRSKYDPTLELVIDPSLIYSTYIGGTNDDQMVLGDLVKDNQGCIYTCGQTMSSNFPVTPGAYDVSANGNYDCFVIKLNKTGTALVYATYIGGSGLDQANSIDINRTTNEVFIAGTTESSNYPTTAGAYQTAYAGGAYDVFVTKINSAGNGLLYSTFVGGSGSDQGFSIKTDLAGNAYVTGQTPGGFPVTASAYQTVYGGGGWDAMAFKLNPAGSALVFSTYVGGTGENRGGGIAIDQNLNIYLHGMTTSGFPTSAGAFQTTYGGGTNDCFVTKLNTSGSTMIYSTYLGGPGDDYERAPIEVDNNGQAYITGLCQSGFPTTTGAYDVTFNGGSYDVFVAKLNSSGSGLVFSTFLGGSGTDIGFNIAFNQNKEVLVTGEASSTFPVTACAYDVTFNGVSDGFLSVLDSTGANLLYSTFIGGSGYDRGNAIVPDGDTVYMVGNTQSSNLPTTTGCFDATYNSGTNDVFALKLVVGPGITVADFNVQSTGCAGENISFTNSSVGATNYSWSFGNGNSSTNVNPVYAYPYAGTYYITLTATGTCGNNAHTDTIVILNAPVITVSHDTTVCSGNPVTLIATGGGTFSWNTTPVQSGSSITISPTASTTYIVTVSNTNGCSVSDTVLVTVNPNPAITTTATPINICQGSPSSLSASSSVLGTTYVWNPGSLGGTPVSVTPSSTTTYSVTGIASGCTGSNTVLVTVKPNPVITPTVTPAIICQGSSSLLSAGSSIVGTTYIWTPGGLSGIPVSVTPSSTTTYSVTGTASGCSGSNTVLVTVNPNPVITPIATPSSICQGSSSSLSAGSSVIGTTYIWTPGGLSGTPVSVTPSSSTTYSITGTAAGCSGSNTVAVTVNPNPTIMSIATPANICQGSSSSLSAGSSIVGTSYIWTPGGLSGTPVSVTPSSTTTYSVIGTAVGCTGSASIMISVNPSVTATTSQVDLICNGDSTGSASVVVNAGSPPYTYLWSSGSNLNNASNLTANQYYVTITDVNGCDTVYSININQPPAINIELTATNETCLNSCDGEISSVVSGGVLPYSYLWSNNEQTATITALCSGNYILTVTDSNSCSFTESINVSSDTAINDNIYANPTQGVSLLLVNFTYSGPAATIYHWDFGDESTSGEPNPIHTYITPGTFNVVLIINIGTTGCSDTLRMIIEVIEPSELNIPNVFTPNGDGKNDEFKVEYKGIETFVCTIYNRWGKKIYEWKEISSGWDGINQNNNAPSADGVYYYIISAMGYDKVKYNKNGTITLLR